MTESEVWSLLEEVVDPVLERTLVDLGLVLDCQVDGDLVELTVFSGGPGADAQQAIADQVFDVLEGAGYTVELHAAEAPTRSFPATYRGEEKPILNPDVSNYVPVVGPKGGVGKTTVAVNLAISLNEVGLDVGIVTTDLSTDDLRYYFPTKRSGVDNTIEADGFQPATVHGLKVLTMWDLYRAGAAEHMHRYWTAEARREAVRNLVQHPKWGELDFLIIDLPPDGFGEETLMACQLPGPGGLLVTAPGLPALEVSKAFALTHRFVPEEELPYRIFGVVENKSGTVCPACQTVIDPPMESPATCTGCDAPLDGWACQECGWIHTSSHESVTVDCPNCGTTVAGAAAGGGRGIARLADVPFIGRIPRDPAIQTGLPQTDEPAVHRDSPGADALTTVRKNVADALAAHNRHTFSEWRRNTGDELVGDWIERARAAVEAEEPLTEPVVKV